MISGLVTILLSVRESLKKNHYLSLEFHVKFHAKNRNRDEYNIGFLSEI